MAWGMAIVLRENVLSEGGEAVREPFVRVMHFALQAWRPRALHRNPGPAIAF